MTSTDMSIHVFLYLQKRGYTTGVRTDLVDLEHVEHERQHLQHKLLRDVIGAVDVVEDSKHHLEELVLGGVEGVLETPAPRVERPRDAGLVKVMRHVEEATLGRVVQSILRNIMTSGTSMCQRSR